MAVRRVSAVVVHGTGGVPFLRRFRLFGTARTLRGPVRLPLCRLTSFGSPKVVALVAGEVVPQTLLAGLYAAPDTPLLPGVVEGWVHGLEKVPSPAPTGLATKMAHVALFPVFPPL